MAMKRKRWLLAAGILLSTASGPLAFAEEPPTAPGVTVTTGVITITDDAVPTPDTGKSGPTKPSKSGSPYNSVPRNAAWQAVDLSPASTKGAPEPQTSHVIKPASAIAEVGPSCNTQAGYASSQNQSGASYWQRCGAHMQDCWLGYRSEFTPTALGEFLYAHGKTQVANGTAARMTVYHDDFEDGRNTLNTRGKDQVAKIATMLPQNFFPVVIERTPETPALAEDRRRVVLAALAKSSFPIPPERVIVGVPMAEGMSGVEAEIIYRNLISQTTQGGLNLPPLGIGGTGGGGTLNTSAAPGAGAGATPGP